MIRSFAADAATLATYPYPCQMGLHIRASSNLNLVLDLEHLDRREGRTVVVVVDTAESQDEIVDIAVDDADAVLVKQAAVVVVVDKCKVQRCLLGFAEGEGTRAATAAAYLAVVE